MYKILYCLTQQQLGMLCTNTGNSLINGVQGLGEKKISKYCVVPNGIHESPSQAYGTILFSEKKLNCQIC